MECDFRGLDVLPLLADEAPPERTSSAQPPRLRLNGRMRLSGSVAVYTDPGLAADEEPLQRCVIRAALFHVTYEGAALGPGWEVVTDATACSA